MHSLIETVLGAAHTDSIELIAQRMPILHTDYTFANPTIVSVSITHSGKQLNQKTSKGMMFGIVRIESAIQIHRQATLVVVLSEL